MSPLAQVVEHRQNDVVVARIEGEVDASNARVVGAKLRSLLTNRSDGLLVDLGGTTYLDSAGIALLFELSAELKLHQQELRLVVDRESSIRRLLQITGLGATVLVFESVVAALA